MKPNHLFFLVAVVGCAMGIALDRLALAQQTGIKRTILLRTDDPAGATHEAVMGIAELPPGASSGKHRHHGTEIGYVLEGSLVVERDGQPTLTLSAGDAFKNEAGVHDAKNPGAKPTKILAVYIVEKGKPLADPVR